MRLERLVTHGTYRNQPGGELVIKPRPSRLLAGILSAVHLITLFVLALLPLSLWILLLLSGAIVVNLGYVFRRHVLLRGKKAVTKLICDTEGSWKVLNGKSNELLAQLHPDTFVSRWLVILNLSTNSTGNYSVVLLPDSLDQDTMRQLRVRIRLYSTHGDSNRSAG